LANPTQDDGFHEIQLNGKQLVFLFMAATVVSVVIFLCGVLVGRGVRAERGSGTETTAMNDAPADITPTQPPPPVTPPPAGSDPTTAAPPPPVDDFTYPKRLEQVNQAAEELRPAQKATSTTSAVPAVASAPAPSPAKATATNAVGAKAAAPTPKTAAPTTMPTPALVPAAAPAPSSAANDRGPAPVAAAADAQPPAGQGYVVQVTALNVRSEADAIAKHLTSKGYAAYVSANGTPAIYRVRVGSFKTRREAETVAAKLTKEEQMKPWVTK
jgi:cell division septation protein DedD